MPRWSSQAPLFARPASRRLALGLGLIGIGKPWGHVNDLVPEEAAVEDLLSTALTLGIRFFDTAPSYGVSEARFGKFLHTLGSGERNDLMVATKFGEHWDAERKVPFVDHSYEALVRSLDGSLKRLGQIDLLQLHKTTPEVLCNKEVERAFAYAAAQGIRNLGASVSDAISASIALSMGMFSVVQFPFNIEASQFREVAEEVTREGMLVLTNRPFGMGKLLHGKAQLTPRAAFDYLVHESYDGVVLTGTKSSHHLRQNYVAFQNALRNDQGALE